MNWPAWQNKTLDGLPAREIRKIPGVGLLPPRFSQRGRQTVTQIGYRQTKSQEGIQRGSQLAGRQTDTQKERFLSANASIILVLFSGLLTIVRKW